MTRVKGVVRWSAFAAATYTLSLFFAGWREINTTGQLSGFVLLALGVVFTGLLIMLQAYWIYFEERNKGSLRRQSKMFEWLHAFIEARFADNKIIRLIQPVIVTDTEGSNK